MSEKLFNITDAHNVMENLTEDMAHYWAKVANREYEKLRKLNSSEILTQRKAVERASKETKAKYRRTK